MGYGLYFALFLGNGLSKGIISTEKCNNTCDNYSILESITVRALAFFQYTLDDPNSVK